LHYLGATLDAASVGSWLGMVAVMAVGLGLFEMVRRKFVKQWGLIQEDIEKELKRREAL
jgi:branched-chain amino acid transport system permease protein